ncbi:S-adenosyl-L-methionine-dependent methyltransferase, partial [Jimgerdemannia flammicorona]
FFVNSFALHCRNFHVPIENLLKKGCTVLDAGCGPGAWTLDMAIEYPDSHFYGIDICPVFDGSVHPPNVTFSLANLTDHLPFPDGHFDFVFMRCLVAGLQNKEWPRVMCELMRVTKQGGWVELVEGSFRPHDAGPILEKIFRQGEKDILNLQFSLGLTSTRSPHSPAPSICRSQLRPESPSPKPVHRAQPRETPSRRWLPALAPLVRPLIVKLVRPARRDAGQRHPRAAHGVQALAEQVHRPVQHKVRRRGRCHVRRVQGEEELFECALRIWDEERAGGVNPRPTFLSSKVIPATSIGFAYMAALTLRCCHWTPAPGMSTACEGKPALDTLLHHGLIPFFALLVDEFLVQELALD